MIARKHIKSRGKLRLSQCFQKLKEGERVAIVREHSLNPAFPVRIQGKTGAIIGKRGSAYIVQLKDGNESKIFIINPAHLKKIG